jgi:hypothetical protein
LQERNRRRRKNAFPKKKPQILMQSIVQNPRYSWPT